MSRITDQKMVLETRKALGSGTLQHVILHPVSKKWVHIIP